jgi:hypothetical protein
MADCFPGKRRQFFGRLLQAAPDFVCAGSFVSFRQARDAALATSCARRSAAPDSDSVDIQIAADNDVP